MGQTENGAEVPSDKIEYGQDFQIAQSDNDPVTVSVMFSYPVLKKNTLEDKKKKSSCEQNQDQFARFVEQELKNHQRLEQECDTLKRKKKMKENELEILADKELKKTECNTSMSTTLETKKYDKPTSEKEEHVQPSASVIKRGVPQNSKPAPAVVAVKMAELLAVPENQDINKEGIEMPTSDKSKNASGDLKQQKQLEKQSQEEQIKLEKEMKQKDKLKKEEEA